MKIVPRWKKILSQSLAMATAPIFLAIAGHGADLPEGGVVERAPVVVTATSATASPLVIERRRPLFQTGTDGRIDAAVVLSQPHPPRRGEGGFLGGVNPGSGDEAVAKWLGAQEAELRTIALRLGREMQSSGGDPTMRVLYNDAARGIDHRPVLQQDGYVGRVRRREAVEGQRLWSAVYTRSSQPESARLGEVTEKVTVRFAPTVDARGVVQLHPTLHAEVTPDEDTPPAGVDPQDWKRAQAAHLRALNLTMRQSLEFRLDRRRIRTPPAAAEAFDVGESYRHRIAVPFWGDDRGVELVLEGTATRQVNESLGEEMVENAETDALISAVRGPWVVTAQPGEGKTLTGFADVSQEGKLSLAIDYDNHSIANRADLRVENGRLRASFYTIRVPLPGDVGQWQPVELQVRKDHNAMRGVWYDKNGDIAGRLTLERMIPTAESVQVVPNGNAALDYRAMVNDWQYVRVNGNRPAIYLDIKGRNFPRYLGGDWDRIYTSATGSWRMEASDPSIQVQKWAANPNGTWMRVWMWLSFGKDNFTHPGKKILLLNDTPIEFDLQYTNYSESAPPHLEQLIFAHVGEAPDRDEASVPIDAPIALSAQYDETPGDDRKQAVMRIERSGQTILTLPPEFGWLIRDRRRAQRYLGEDFSLQEIRSRINPAGDGVATEYQFQYGDMLVAELDGVSTRMMLTSAEKARIVRPWIRFSADPDGKVWIGGQYTGEIRLDHLPVGQEFWIEASYPRPQAEAEKILTLSWDGGRRDVVLPKVEPATFRAGPFMVEPPPDEPGEPGVGPEDETADPEGEQ